jgi:hypothetical protein
MKGGKEGISWPSRGSASAGIDPFLKGMRELGYVEGNDFELLYRFSDGYADRIPSLAEEVVRLKPDVIHRARHSGCCKKTDIDDPNRHRGTRRPGSPWSDSERGTARRQCHWNRTIRGGLAR